MRDAIIVGAGPAGLATAACLGRAGISYTLLERNEAVGSSWRNHYARLHLHTVKRFSHLPHLPFPRDYPRYVPRALVVEYLDDYAKRFGIEARFGQAVKSAKRDGEAWIVETEKETFEGKRLIIATGYNRKPKIPTWPGQETFEGEILHASQYQTAKAYRNKRVLVVGMGNTGAELGLDLVEQGALEPAISVHSPVHVLPRDFMGLPSQVTGLILSRIPVPIADRMGINVSKAAFGDLSAYGIERPRIGPLTQVVKLGRIPVLDVGTIRVIKQGRLKVVPGIERFDGETVRFTDGTQQKYEVVVLATGYSAALDEYLEGAGDLTDARGYPKQHGADSMKPGLFFLGFRNPPIGQLFDINREAQAIADAIAKS